MSVYRYLIVVLTIIMCSVAAGCRPQSARTDNAGFTDGHADSLKHTHVPSSKYVCPMHPQITSDKPGQCSICGMDLVEVATGSIMLTPTQERLANIRVQQPDSGEMKDARLINARVVANEEQRSTISSRAAGRIERLYVRETGRPIKAGQPLYDLYSEALNSQIQEYLILRDQHSQLGDQRSHYAALLNSAENKLVRYGLSRTQIARLSAGTTRVTFLAPAGGQVTELLVSEGQYVDEGTLMFRLDNLAKLWLEAELYPGEAQTFKMGEKVSARIGSLSKSVEVRVSFLAPVYRENTQVVLMRATLDNDEGIFIPGMQATLNRRHSRGETLQLPIDAVIRDGRNAYTFVRNGDHTYNLRVVRTGAENASAIEITDGLGESDVVVVSGSYLLYSEWILRNGSDFMAHVH